MLNSKKLLFIFALSIVLLILALQGCSRRVDDISINDISNFDLRKTETQETKKCSQEQIKDFVNAYNKATYFRDVVGTTNPFSVCIDFTDGQQLIVWGGTQGFQTQVRNQKQNNIKSSELDLWFENIGGQE